MANDQLEALKKALAEKKEKKSQAGENRPRKNNGDKASYPFWDTPIGQTSIIRFLPDSNSDNAFFWASREVCKLPFSGVVGGDYPTDKEVVVTVPCMNMWGLPCPVISGTRSFWKGNASELAIAKKYWKKKSFICQGLIVSSAFEEDDAPENPIRRFVLGPAVFEKVEEGINDPEMENSPIDYVGGYDFRISVTKKGDYKNYANSKFSARSRSLGEAELAAIEQYGLNDLSTFLGPKPDADGVEAIKSMFEASLAGEPYDFNAFGQYYKPYTNRDNAGNNSNNADEIVTGTRTSVSESKPVIEDNVADVSKTDTGKPSPQDILMRIKQRTAKTS